MTKQLISLFRLTLIIITLWLPGTLSAAEVHCPMPDELHRIPGTYTWYSTQPGWSGGFNRPQKASGHSTKIKHFLRATWVQLNNLAHSPGFIQCEYRGDYSKEVLRFEQDRTHSARKPKKAEFNWQCKLASTYPKSSCSCTSGPAACALAAG